MVFYAAFNCISHISRRQLTLFMSSWVSPVLGWGSKVSCPRTLPRKNPEDPVWLKLRTPGLRVKHFTTEPRRTPESILKAFAQDKVNDVNPLLDDKFLDSSKMNEFAGNNFKLDVTGRRLSKRVENASGKGEIARYQQFLLFPQCFQKACFPGASKGVIVCEWVKITISVFDRVENIVGKGENAQVTSIFFFSHNVFPKASPLRSLKDGIAQ